MLGRRDAAALVAGARSGVARYRDPAARLRRRRRRARWGVGVRAVPTVGVSLLAADAFVAGNPVVGGAVAAVAAAGVWVTGQATRHAWRLHRLPLPAPARPLPPRGSAARGPLQRLASQERALDQLTGLLGASAAITSDEADSAATALREYGQRIVAVEAARSTGSRADRRDVDAAAKALTTRLEAGVRAHARLVAAAADAVAASSGRPDAVALRRVTDETDRLRGLAMGLRELDA